MHLNKLSTAALMRLTILASLNLLLGRLLGYWDLLHPLFFLILVTLNLGLYAVMVYSGTLNWTLIATMVAGLVVVMAVLIFGGGLDPSVFLHGGPYPALAERIEGLVNATIGAFPGAGFRAPPKPFWWVHGLTVAYLAVDAIGLGVISASGMVARIVQARSIRREPEASVASS